MSERVVVEFPSAYKYLNIIDLICGEIMADMNFTREARNEVSISVIEACTNALEHGNECCPEKYIRVTIEKLPDRLLIEVFDRGSGFDYEDYLRHIPDPSNVHKLRGRGIYIMNTMMDVLSFEMLPGGGMKVRLEKLVSQKQRKIS
jgi:anti-sigma regulatory factor (Ser/Thr protein kinase)